MQLGRVHVPTSLMVSAGVGAVATYLVTGDEVGNAGPRDGWLVPATIAGVGVTTGLVALASRGGWRWSGGEALHAASRAATGPLLAAAVGGTAALGVTMLTDLLGGVRPDRSGDGARDLDAQAATLDAANDARDATVQAEHDSAINDRAASRRELDRLYDANGGFAPRTSVGAGRLDVAGRSPEAAVDLILTAYGDDDGKIGIADVRIVGPSTFALTNFIQHAGGNTGVATREQLVGWMGLNVDTREPKGSIDASESVDWQSGRYGEQRTGPEVSK
jgi:hypothetical protein